jgi:hypothetical protein
MIICAYCGKENSDLATHCNGCGQAMVKSDGGGRPDLGDRKFQVIVLRTFTTLSAAQIAANFLEASGITSIISADDCGGMLPALQPAGGVRVLVDSAEQAQAEAVLRELDSGSAEADLDSATPPPSPGQPPPLPS